MKRLLALASIAALCLPQTAGAFCGFYVAKADASLFNKASRVVLVRDGDRTVITMANDYQGDPRDFALVVPVPTFLEREQIHVTEMSFIDHLDAYTAPRLVEYFDQDPCQVFLADKVFRMSVAQECGDAFGLDERNRSLGVTVEATYAVGEYDIVILSAKESAGLETWLTENGYRIPDGASRVLGSYLKQGMRFFVAKVNLEEHDARGATFLRPLQIAYESPKFMLPIRLGTVNANGPQDLLLYALTRTGRVETTNYRTVRLPTDSEIPTFVKNEFPDFYRDMFSQQVRREGMRAVFLEYAWDMAWCDPCAADPLSRDELRELGVFWLEGGARPGQPGWPSLPNGRIAPPRPQAENVYVTRLHVRYDAETFPEDLMLQETGDRSNFQGRYVLRHPWKGTGDCEQAAAYREELSRRQNREAETLANLTGWDLAGIRDRMQLALAPAKVDEAWWQWIWGQ